MATLEQDLKVTRNALAAKEGKLGRALATITAMQDAEAAKDGLLRDMRDAIEQAEEGTMINLIHYQVPGQCKRGCALLIVIGNQARAGDLVIFIGHRLLCDMWDAIERAEEAKLDLIFCKIVGPRETAH